MSESDLPSKLRYHATGDSLSEVRKKHPFAATLIEGYFVEAADRIEALEAALRPFVEGANIYADESGADEPSHGRGWIRRRHLFAARKALEGVERIAPAETTAITTEQN